MGGAWTGFLLVNNVTSALHTPLMSLTNAISGIVILAGILAVSPTLNTDQRTFDYISQFQPYRSFAEEGIMTVENVCTVTPTDELVIQIELTMDSVVPGTTSLCLERGIAS